VRVPNSQPGKLLSFVRQNERDKVFGVFNLSDHPQIVTFNETLCHGEYRDYLRDESAAISASTRLDLNPWDYRVFVR